MYEDALKKNKTRPEKYSYRKGVGDARCLFQQPYILNKEKNSREKGFIKMGLGIF